MVSALGFGRVLRLVLLLMLSSRRNLQVTVKDDR